MLYHLREMVTYPDASPGVERIERLKAIRKRLGWSGETCAHELGVSYSTLSRWERGESLPKSRVVLKAIEYFIATHGKGQFEGR